MLSENNPSIGNWKVKSMKWRQVAYAGLVMGLSHNVQAKDQVPDFLKVSLQDVVDMQVTSVSKKSEKASEAAASIYVLTNEDIRRSGANNLVEALRLVPGVQVARAGSSQWAVSARGFNDQFANKLLVLIDGRTVYSPTFSGVWWDIQNPPLEDIERIEIIRGPGASVWGANAVNGVINIITKPAEETQGALLTVGTGTDLPVNTRIRQGMKLSDTAWMRVYAAHEAHDEAKRADDTGNQDDWEISRAGFRTDWEKNNADRFTFQGDMYYGEEDQRYQLPTLTAPYSRTVDDRHNLKGAYMLGRWDREVNENSNTTLQTYVDYNARDIEVQELQEFTFDLDFQHIYEVNGRNTLTWGMGYRYLNDHLSNDFEIDYELDSYSRHLFSGFFEHKLALVPEEWFLTFGSKFEQNAFSGFEHQPTVRLSWLVDPHQTVWTSVSRAVRTPDRSNRDIINPLASQAGPGGLTTMVVRRGSDDIDSERLMAYEAGYRIQPRSNLAFDLSVFHNSYDNLIINSLGTPRLVGGGLGAPYIEVPLTQVNGGEGQSYGGTLGIDWQARSWWNLELNYSYIDIQLKGGSSSVNTEYKTPDHQVSLQSRIDLPHNLEFDQYLSYTDSVSGTSGEHVPAYWLLNARLGWQPTEAIEVSLSARNLLDSYHAEFGPFIYNEQAEIGRSVYGQLKISF